MENQQAIPPTFNIPKFIKEMKQEEKKDSETFTDRDKAFAMLAQSDEWKELKEYIEARIKRLENLLRSNVEGAELQHIGAKFLVVDLASGELEDIISKVEYAREHIERQEKGTT